MVIAYLYVNKRCYKQLKQLKFQRIFEILPKIDRSSDFEKRSVNVCSGQNSWN